MKLVPPLKNGGKETFRQENCGLSDYLRNLDYADTFKFLLA